MNKPKGSMTGGTIRRQIEEAEKQKKAERQEANKAERAESVQDKDGEDFDPSSLLPKVVPSALGDLPYAKFKDKYHEIYNQILDGEHLITGFVLHLCKFGKIEIQLRSLTTKEAAFVHSLIPMNMHAEDASERMALFNQARLAIAVRRVMQTEHPKLPAPKIGEEEDWFATDIVKQVVDVISNWDETFSAVVSNILDDIGAAKGLALREALLNP